MNPWLGRVPGEPNANPLQYACLGIPMDRGAWQATDYEVAESTRLSACVHVFAHALVRARAHTHTHTHTHTHNN